MRFSALCLLFAAVAQAEVLNLTEDNYVQATAGKTVFIKFYAPWCGHCKAMAPSWERLATDWEDHEVGLVAEVDCTEEPELCEDFEVEGYPTLVYGDPAAPETYDGSRDYDELASFAKENLGQAICSIYNSKSCSDEEKTVIKSLDGKTLEQLNEALGEIEKAAEDAEQKFDEKVEAIQQQYEVVVEEYNDQVEQMRKDSNYHFLRAAIVKKENDGKDEEF